MTLAMAPVRLLALAVFVSGGPALADEVRHIPDEYETTSGHGIAMNNAGYAANDGYTAVRANPALLATQKEYTASAGFHWPVSGRDYFQAGIVDSKTSSVAAGVSYTGFQDDYAYPDAANGAGRVSPYDSPVVRRGVVGVAQNFGAMSFGIGGTYVEANPLMYSQEWVDGQTRVKGTGLNFGVAGALGKGLAVGGSVENASNRKIADYVPKTYRGGVAYQLSPMISGYLDARQRDRVPEFESDETVQIGEAPAKKSDILDNPERMIIGSLVAQVQDFLRLVGSYGQSVTDDRRSVAGGAVISSKNFSLSYTIARPYMKESATHQAVALSMQMSM